MPADLILTNSILTVLAPALWAGIWHFLLKEKIMEHNRIIRLVREKILQKHDQEYQKTKKSDEKTILLGKTVDKLDILEEKKIIPQDIDKYFFWSIFLSITAIIGQLITVDEKQIFVANITFAQAYNYSTIGAYFSLLAFVYYVYKANKTISENASLNVMTSNIEEEFKGEQAGEK